MAKKAYIGVDGTARKMQKCYLGIDEVARAIKKAYIGVGGVARPCWSLAPIEHYGINAFQQSPRADHVAVTLGGYALFAGDAIGYNPLADIFDQSLTNVQVSVQMAPVRNLAATVIKTTNTEFAIFAGGLDVNDSPTDMMYIVDTSLTARQLGRISAARGWFTATTVSSPDNSDAIAVFAGGSADSSSGFNTPYGGVDVLSSSLTYFTSALHTPRCAHASATAGQNALFAGGLETGYVASSNIESLNYSGTSSVLGFELMDPVYFNSATSNGSAAVFSCGYNSELGEYGRGTMPSVIDTSLTGRVIKSTEPVDRTLVAATTLGNYAMFGGGTGQSTMIYYNYDGLTAISGHPLSFPRFRAAATTLGNYALFGGGGNSGDDLSTSYTVDMYKLME